jgi:hypothetical protein
MRKLYRYFFPVRGKGFSGGKGQKRRSDQISQIQQIFPNQKFIDNYPELLRCNEQYFNLAGKIDVGDYLVRYHELTKSWLQYPVVVKNLKGWVDSQGNSWPRLHPMHQTIVDIIKEYRPKSVCEVGAGSGMVAKYVYASVDGKIELTCIEGSASHISSMKENFTFTTGSHILEPNINVNAKVIEAVAQNIPMSDGEVELLYTCTLQLHIPFVAAVLASAEYARVSKKYILHVEGIHVDAVPIVNWVSAWRRNLAGIFPRLGRLIRSESDGLLIDYSRLYSLLGFKTIKKIILKDPYSNDYDYIVFLAERE